MTTITIQNKPVQVHLTKAAEKALQQRESALYVEMELYFSCLIRKQVLFHERQRQADSIAVNDKLSVSFHPVMTESCLLKEAEPEPAKSDFEIHRPECFTPRWLKLDYKKGSWFGEYGYRLN